MFEEKLKKSNFFNFFVKIDADHLSSIACFSNLCQKIWNLSQPVLWKHFEIKSHQRRAHYLKRHRNGGPLRTGGGLEEPPPPHWLGLTLMKLNFLCIKNHEGGGIKQVVFAAFFALFWAKMLNFCPKGVLDTSERSPIYLKWYFNFMVFLRKYWTLQNTHQSI